MRQERFTGREIPESPFASDDGSADAALAAAIEAGDRYALSACLQEARLLVPVVAVLDTLLEPEGHEGASPGEARSGHAVEKDSHMASVTLVRSDGRHALLAFTSTGHVRAWREDARPVAVRAREVAQVAREADQALIIDVDRTHPVVIDGPDLHALAEGRVLTPPWHRSDVAEAVGRIFGPAIAQRAMQVRLGPGQQAQLLIEVDPAAGVRIDAGELERLLVAALAPLDDLDGGVEVRLRTE